MTWEYALSAIITPIITAGAIMLFQRFSKKPQSITAEVVRKELESGMVKIKDDITIMFDAFETKFETQLTHHFDKNEQTHKELFQRDDSKSVKIAVLEERLNSIMDAHNREMEKRK